MNDCAYVHTRFRMVKGMQGRYVIVGVYVVVGACVLLIDELTFRSNYQLM